MTEYKTISLTAKEGRLIPCAHTLTGKEKQVILIFHGFGSSKESPTVKMLEEHLPQKGMGTFAIDFPAHGESPADGASLTLENCLSDMSAAEQEVKRLAPGAEIGYFGSSFGAYMTLLYLAAGKGTGKRAFLRSAAVEMPDILRSRAGEAGKQLLEQQGYLMADEGYVRPLKLVQELFDELDENNVFDKYKKGIARLRMVHGTKDEEASFEAAERFARMAGAEFTAVEGGDHQLSRPGMPERVLELAQGFFMNL